MKQLCNNIVVRVAALLAVALSQPASAQELSPNMKKADAAIDAQAGSSPR